MPVALSVREVDPSGIGDPNWQNLHIRERYVGGMGVVASLATVRTPEGRPSMIVSGIPPEFSAEHEALESLRMTRPQIPAIQTRAGKHCQQFPVWAQIK